MSANRDCVGTFDVERAQYTLTVTTAGTGSGSVSGGGTYAAGTVTGVAAVADDGSTFTGWTGNADCADAQVTMDANKHCVAVFDRVESPGCARATDLGGIEAEGTYGVAIHPTNGDVYVVGTVIVLGPTLSADFPGVAGGADTTAAGYNEVFVARLDPCLTTIRQATYLGGDQQDWGYDIAIHPTTGEVYVTGWTSSSDLPGIAGGADVTRTDDEAFVTRLDARLTAVLQSTYLGGGGTERGVGLAIHPAIDAGSAFAGWAGDCAASGAGSTSSVTMDANRACTATSARRPGPDLVATALSVPEAVRRGKRIKVRYRIENQGDQPAARKTKLRLVLSTDGAIGADDRTLGTAKLPKVPPAGVHEGLQRVRIPKKRPAGAYFVGVVADAADAVAEANQANNARSAPTAVTDR